MKAPIKILLPFFTLMGVATLLSNCTPKHNECEDENTYKEYSISPNTINQIPYRKDGLDTLVYISTVGDTSILYGRGVQKRYEQNRVDENVNPDCANYTNYKAQVIDYSYIGDQLDFNRLTFYLYNYIYSATLVDEVANYTSKNQYNVAFMNIFQPHGDYLFEYINNDLNYDDSIIVNNTTYYGKKIYPKTDSISILYNNKYGAMKVETGGKIWIKKF